MVKGEIYALDLFPRSGSELRGIRPCIVVSCNLFSSSPGWRSATVVPLSSSPRWLDPSPHVVLFDVGESGLAKRCAALTHQVTTVDKGKIKGPPIGRLTPEKEAALAEALRNYLGID